MDSTDISDFRSRQYSFLGKQKTVLRVGDRGPAVIVIHEIYGFTPTLARFCRWVSSAGFQVYAPILFGRPDATNREEQSLMRLVGLCVSREINLFASGRSSPIIEWLKPLCREAYRECGGKGVGVIGMCLTGGFALSLAVDPAVLAPVLAQPGLPAFNHSAIDVSSTDLGIVRQRIQGEGLAVLGYRFQGDKICRAERFDALQNTLGTGFKAHALPDTSANPNGPMARAKQPPHSVFTGDLIDEPGQPTREAVNEVVAFFTARLRRTRADQVAHTKAFRRKNLTCPGGNPSSEPNTS
ncbi:MAG: dienelactone hydrolase family protein [Rudaea sp.]